MQKVKKVKETTSYKLARPAKDIPWVTKSGKEIMISEKQAVQFSAQRKQMQLAHVIAKEAAAKFGGKPSEYMASGVDVETGDIIKGAVEMAGEIVDEGYAAAWDNMWMILANNVVNAIAMSSKSRQRIYGPRWARAKLKEQEMDEAARVAGGRLLTYRETANPEIHALMTQVVFASDAGIAERAYANNWAPIVDILKEIGYNELGNRISELGILLTHYERDSYIGFEV